MGKPAIGLAGYPALLSQVPDAGRTVDAMPSRARHSSRAQGRPVPPQGVFAGCTVSLERTER